jgi:hypothetical protein
MCHVLNENPWAHHSAATKMLARLQVSEAFLTQSHLAHNHPICSNPFIHLIQGLPPHFQLHLAHHENGFIKEEC